MVQNNSHDVLCLTNSKTEMFSVMLEMREVMSCHRCGGKLFHTRGPVALKLQSPKLLYVCGTKHALTVAKSSRRYSVFVTSWMSSAMYARV